jgi:hypothetical protein
MYLNANKSAAIIITRKALPPHPPPTPRGYKISLKTLQFNAPSEKKTMPQN